MRMTVLITAALFALTTAPAAARDSEVFILGALHGLHEKEDSFSYEALGQVIRAIKPDVILLEVTPEELAGKIETKGRPEYPKVIWPMLASGGPTAIAMEAAQPLYGELTGDAGKRWGAFAKQHPAESAALTRYGESTTDVLLVRWKSVADTQDEATDALGRARNRLNAALVAGSDAGQMRWDAVMVDAAKTAIAANPGKRVLVLGSYRNRYMFVDELSRLRGVTLVDMRNWLEANGFGSRSLKPVGT